MPNKVTVVIDNNQFEFFKSISVKKSLDNFSGDFTISITPPKTKDIESLQKNIISKVGSSCQILVDGEPLLSGYIYNVSISNTSSQTELVFSGYEKTYDIAQSTLSSKQINAPISLRHLIINTISELGFVVVNSRTLKNRERIFSNLIAVIDYSTPLRFSGNEIFYIKGGETAFNAIKRFFQKKQIIITTDTFGNIVLEDVGDGGNAFAELRLLDDDENNNIISDSLNLSQDNRFYKYTTFSDSESILSSKGERIEDKVPLDVRPDVLVSSEENSENAGVVSSSFDAEIRKTRRYVNVASQSLTLNQVNLLNRWENNIRKSQSLTYQVTKNGWRHNSSSNLNENGIWLPNQIVKVVSVKAGIDSTMLVRSVSYTLSETNGSIVTLNLIDRSSYTTLLEEPVINKPKSEVAEGLQNTGIFFDDIDISE